MAEPLKMEVVSPRFWMTPLRKVTTETNEVTGRTYFILDGKIIAVAKKLNEEDSNWVRSRN
jgi:hypothetical protein